MGTPWQEYQIEVASVFRSLGLSAEIEVDVTGVRSCHCVDVLVEFRKWGISIRWIAECKLWKSRVTKEKVLALYQIAQDLGADRAFLFSETGFQAGAVAAAGSTNITLTNVNEMRDAASEEISRAGLNAALTPCAILLQCRNIRY